MLHGKRALVVHHAPSFLAQPQSNTLIGEGSREVGGFLEALEIFRKHDVELFARGVAQVHKLTALALEFIQGKVESVSTLYLERDVAEYEEASILVVDIL
jgi:hypothetical protein